MKTPEEPKLTEVYTRYITLNNRAPISWECPYCGTLQTTASENFVIRNLDTGKGMLKIIAISCLNTDCRNYSVFIYHGNYSGNECIFDGMVYPITTDPPFINLPDYIVHELSEDYQQAYRILKISPKASAALSRRCLEGMIDTKWPNLKSKRNLFQKITALEEVVETPRLIEALQQVRDIGRIGAHMQDANKISEVAPDEAEIMIQLLEDLFQLWFIDEHQREERLKKIISRKNNADNTN